MDADEINYDEYTGIATAEGNVRVRNKEIRMFAPYVEYNTKTHVVDAYSDYRENVVVYSGIEKYIGKHLNTTSRPDEEYSRRFAANLARCI